MQIPVLKIKNPFFSCFVTPCLQVVKNHETLKLAFGP